MKKKAVVIAVIILVVAAWLGHTLYSEHRKVQAVRSLEVHFTNIRVVDVGREWAILELELVFYNPTGTTVSFDRASYLLYANGDFVGTGTIMGVL